MIELHFADDLYDGFAIDEAAKTYAGFAQIDLERQPERYVVRVTALPAATEEGIAEGDISAELVNAALGKTIERRGGAQ